MRNTRLTNEEPNRKKNRTNEEQDEPGCNKRRRQEMNKIKNKNKEPDEPKSERTKNDMNKMVNKNKERYEQNQPNRKEMKNEKNKVEPDQEKK